MQPEKPGYGCTLRGVPSALRTGSGAPRARSAMVRMNVMKALPLMLGAGMVALAAGVVLAMAVPADAQGRGKQAKTPDNWSYEIKQGRRVPRGNRVTNEDGSWREEVRRGDCVLVKTMSAQGEYREVREC